MLVIRPYQEQDEQDVIALWQESGITRPWNDPAKDIARKLKVFPDLFLVGLAGGRIVGTVMAGYEGHRGWLNYLAVAPAEQRKGYGTLLVQAAEDLLRAVGCPKVNLQVRAENRNAIDFYRKSGYAIDEVVSLGKRLEQDTSPT